MVLEIERCPNVGVAYQGTKGHWEELQIVMATTPGRQLGVRFIPGGRRPPGLEKRRRGRLWINTERWKTTAEYQTSIFKRSKQVSATETRSFQTPLI